MIIDKLKAINCNIFVITAGRNYLLEKQLLRILEKQKLKKLLKRN